MAEGDGAAVDVDLVHVPAGFPLPCQDHRGEGLVDLDQIDLFLLHAALLQRIGGGGYRRGEHPHRIGAAHADVVHARARFEAVLLHRARRGDQHRRAGVGDLAGNSRSEAAALL